MRWQEVALIGLLAIAGCFKSDAQKRAEVKANLDNIGRALREYEKTHPPQYDENGQPLKKQSETESP